MNYLILTCGFVSLLLSVNGQLNDDHREVREKCYREMKLANDAIQTSAYRQDPNSKCYLKCYLQSLKALKEDSTIDEVQSVKLIPEQFREQSRPVIRSCIEKIAEINDGCEKAFAGLVCLENGAEGIVAALGFFEPPKAV